MMYSIHPALLDNNTTDHSYAGIAFNDQCTLFAKVNTVCKVFKSTMSAICVQHNISRLPIEHKGWKTQNELIRLRKQRRDGV